MLSRERALKVERDPLYWCTDCDGDGFYYQTVYGHGFDGPYQDTIAVPCEGCGGRGLNTFGLIMVGELTPPEYPRELLEVCEA